MTTTKIPKTTLADMYLESGLSMIDLAKREGIDAADVHAAIHKYSRHLLARVKRQAAKAMPEGVTCEITSQSAPVPSTVWIEVRSTDSWIDAESSVEIDTSEPIAPQLADAIAAVVEAAAAPRHVSKIDDDGLPIGVYQIESHYFADGWHSERSSDRTGLGYVERLLRDGTRNTKEVVVCQCMSQPGGCVIAGSAEAMRRWLSRE